MRVVSVGGVFLAIDDVLHCLAPLSFLCEYIIAYKYPVVNTFFAFFYVKIVLTDWPARVVSLY